MFAFPFIGNFTVNEVVHNVGEINQYKEHYYVIVDSEVGPESFTKGFNLINNEIYR